MPSLGPLEILVILLVALLVFGPNKLPDIARQVGKGMAEFRRVQHHLRREVDDAMHSVMSEGTNQPDPTSDPALPGEVLDVTASAVEGAPKPETEVAEAPAGPDAAAPPLADDQPPPPPTSPPPTSPEASPSSPADPETR